MTRVTNILKGIIFLSLLTVFLFPTLVEASKHGGGCGCGSTTYYNYPGTYLGSSRTGGLFSLYPGSNYFSTPIGLGSTYNQPYLLSGTFPTTLGTLGFGYNYPLAQQTSKEYNVEESRTTYFPGYSVTNTVSQGIEFSTYPQISSYSFLNPYSTSLLGLRNVGINPSGLGNWGGFTGFGW